MIIRWIFPNFPKYSGLFNSSGSAIRVGKPDTNTRLDWTTLVSELGIFRLVVSSVFIFLFWSLCFLRVCINTSCDWCSGIRCVWPTFIKETSSDERGLKPAGLSENTRLQAGHRPFPTVRMRFQQKRQIWGDFHSDRNFGIINGQPDIHRNKGRSWGRPPPAPPNTTDTQEPPQAFYGQTWGLEVSSSL